MASTLIEYAKTAANNGQTKAAAVIAMFADSSRWLGSLPLKPIVGNAYAYNREGVLPGVAFRGVNESYTEGTGVINPLVEMLRICGGDLDCDLALVQMFGPARRAQEERMKIKALTQEITRVLIKGDSITQPREFDGLQLRLTGLQVVSNTAAAGGAGLSLAQLDLAISRCAKPSAIWCTTAQWLRFAAARRTPAVSGNIFETADEFGRPQMTYGGLPLVRPYPDNDGTEPVAFDEANTGGGAAVGSSMYVVGLGEGYLSGLQNGAMQVRDLGELDASPLYRTRVEWLMGLCLEHGRAAVRLRDISNAAITA